MVGSIKRWGLWEGRTQFLCASRVITPLNRFTLQLYDNIKLKIYLLKGTNMQCSGWMGRNKNCQTESMVEIRSKCLVRAIGKVLLMKFN